MIKGEFRSHDTKDNEIITKNITEIVQNSKKYAVNINLSIYEVYKGFSYDKEDPIIKLVNKAIQAVGLIPTFERTGGGSNTNIYNEHKIKSLTLAVGMNKVHSTDEYIEVKDLINLVNLIEKIVEIG